MNMNLAKKVAKMIAKKRQLEDDLRAVKEDIAQHEPQLLDEMVANQLERLQIPVEGQKISIYIHKQLWTKPKEDRAEVVSVLKKCGLSDFVSENYNSNSLSAYVRERLANGEKLQPTLEKCVELTEVVSIRGRRSPVTNESKTAKAVKTLRS